MNIHNEFVRNKAHRKRIIQSDVDMKQRMKIES